MPSSTKTRFEQFRFHKIVGAAIARKLLLDAASFYKFRTGGKIFQKICFWYFEGSGSRAGPPVSPVANSGMGIFYTPMRKP
jgi:hypothetical protein